MVFKIGPKKPKPAGWDDPGFRRMCCCRDCHDKQITWEEANDRIAKLLKKLLLESKENG